MSITERELVSVVMPVCDETKYLEEAVSSIRNQTYRNWELIVIDGSQDGKKIRETLPEDARIHYFQRERRGIADALNYGISRAQGEFIARMDADDISAVTRLEKQVAYFRYNLQVDVLGTWFDKIRSDGTIFEERRPVTEHAAICANLLFENPMCHPSVMMRRAVIEQGDVYSMVVAEDYELWTRLVQQHRFAILPESLLGWRRCENSVSLKQEEAVSASDIKVAKDYVKRMFQIESGRYSDGAFIKNYRREKLKLWLLEKGPDAMMEEAELLYVLLQNAEDISDSMEWVLEEVNRRWLLCMELVDCFTGEMRQLYQEVKRALATRTNLFCSIGEVPKMKKTHKVWKDTLYRMVAANFDRGRELRKSRLKFVLCGMGADGIRALQHYNCNKKNVEENWELVGLVDRKAGAVKMEEEEYEVFTKEALKSIEYDVLLIASFKYYDEIKAEVLQLGVEEKKIMRDSVLWY